MTHPASPIRGLSPASAGILFILFGVFCISINDMLIKLLSGDYPLHQMVFVRSAIGIAFTLVLVQLEGGWRILKTNRPWLHMLRGLMIVFANMTYFMALAVMPIADATALFFVAPLFITLLSIPVLGEKVGVRRIGAIVVGFLGVLLMVRPGGMEDAPPLWVLSLPVAAAFGYAMMQVLTRKLGMSSKASAMAVYIQGMFLLVGGAFFLVAGDGRYAEGLTNESLIFLLRAWVWPQGGDIWLFLLLGLMSAIVGYALSQAYRLGDAATIAAYEYVALPLAVMWGWMIFGTLPGLNAWMGIFLIAASGVYVFLRERVRRTETEGARPLRR
ncbi:MAG: DMT family transporter [Pseudomonadota bacterium]